MVTQRVLSYKKKIKLTVMNMHSKLLNNDSVYPPLSAGAEIEPPTKFSKKMGGEGGGLTGPQLLVWICWERGGIALNAKSNVLGHFHLIIAVI